MSSGKDELEFMSNLSAAVQERTNRGARLIVFIIFIALIWLIVWAYYAELDEVTRGMGRVIPSSKIQIVQNLEGGIVEDILVKPGDQLEKGQPLLKIKNQRFQSTFEESKIRLNELYIKIARLKAEVGLSEFKLKPELASAWPDLVTTQKGLFKSNMGYLANQDQMIDLQVAQKRSEISEASGRIKSLNKNLALLSKQIKMIKPLVDRKIESETGYIQLQREKAGINERLGSARSSIPRLRNAINELSKKKEELQISFKTRAQKELNEALVEIAKLEEKKETFQDQVTRTLVKSPIKGVVKQMYVNTIGGVVKPGMDLVEIVPIEESLLIEAKIRPVDIAFLYPGQEATVKVTAYDFSIYGGLKGKVSRISADALRDERGQTYFLVEIKAEKMQLGTADKPLKIIPGMTVSVDILTGKKSVLNYILKPILKAKQNALSER